MKYTLVTTKVYFPLKIRKIRALICKRVRVGGGGGNTGCLKKGKCPGFLELVLQTESLFPFNGSEGLMSRRLTVFSAQRCKAY